MRYGSDWHSRAAGEGRPSRGRRGPGYDAALSPRRWDARAAGRPAQRYGEDYWWLGEREMERRGRTAPYDYWYRRFSEEHHPRYSPVGGMHPALGGGHPARRPPAPLREPRWLSDWTRWF
jgi:hypothetical protein